MDDAQEAHAQSVAHGAVSVLDPTPVTDSASGQEQVVAEIAIYGDVVLRFVSGSFQVATTALEYLCMNCSQQMRKVPMPHSFHLCRGGIVEQLFPNLNVRCAFMCALRHWLSSAGIP